MQDGQKRLSDYAHCGTVSLRSEQAALSASLVQLTVVFLHFISFSRFGESRIFRGATHAPSNNTYPISRHAFRRHPQPPLTQAVWTTPLSALIVTRSASNGKMSVKSYQPRGTLLGIMGYRIRRTGPHLNMILIHMDRCGEAEG